MKYLFIILLFTLCSCKKEKDSSFVLNESFTIAPGTKACLRGENVCITFEKVNNDSRCPLNAMCFWEGVAEVNLLLQIKESSYPITLHTIQKMQYRKDTVIQGYTVKLEQLNPYPEGKPIEQKDYRVQLIVSK